MSERCFPKFRQSSKKHENSFFFFSDFPQLQPLRKQMTKYQMKRKLNATVMLALQKDAKNSTDGGIKTTRKSFKNGNKKNT